MAKERGRKPGLLLTNMHCNQRKRGLIGRTTAISGPKHVLVGNRCKQIQRPLGLYLLCTKQINTNSTSYHLHPSIYTAEGSNTQHTSLLNDPLTGHTDKPLTHETEQGPGGGDNEIVDKRKKGG